MKPELLLPAGNVEAFYAALEGGADAIYLGLSDFNARKRARNFTIQQLPSLIELAHKKKTKLYVTLNTVIKNEELASLYILLSQLAQTDVDAVIIQDLGTLYLIKKHFPKLEVHASTQMAFHNSVGANFGKKLGLERVILARELTRNELVGIRKKSKSQLELFVHGALCYSFSGLCLFSSYLGGMSANRGACKQPCRRLFTDKKTKHYIFSLKDNELIDMIPELCELGIDSLKIEGRMKSADYVYTIARSYRMVIDDHSLLSEAKKLLKLDIGREKTSYFMGGNVSDAITEVPNTGMFTGKITLKNKDGFEFTSKVPPKDISRIRVCSPDGNRQINLKIHDFELRDGRAYVQQLNKEIEEEDLVYVIGFSNKKFPSKLQMVSSKPIKKSSYQEALNKTKSLLSFSKMHGNKLFFRVDVAAWLRKIRLEDVDFLILKLPFKEWQDLPLESKFLASNKKKLIAELPKFISEENCIDYKKLLEQLYKRGINQFMVSHISQLDLLPKKAVSYANESVYTFNDASVAHLKQLGVSNHVYPLENDFKNLLDGEDRGGIVPIHFTPQLFYSRMPVKTFDKEGEFSDDTGVDYKVIKREGMTVTVPHKSVSILQNKFELTQKGFKHFLIDVSFSSPSQNLFKTVIKRYYKGEQMQPSTSFNFKKGLT